MTYRTKTDKQKKRLEIIVGIFFILTILACGIFYNYAEGLSLLQAAEKILKMFLNFMLIASFGMALLFVSIIGERMIRKSRNKKASK